jgi:hypothetical protein
MKNKKIYQIFFVLAVLCNASLCAKVRILAFHYNQADFIELQYKTFSKFLVEDFEMIVFNDAATASNKEQIENVCKKCGITCVRFEPEWHFTDPLNTYLHTLLQDPTISGYWNWSASTPIEELAQHPSVRHSHVIQYALDHYGYDHDDIVALMDGDNFLVKRLSVASLLKSCDIAAFSRWGIDEVGSYRKQSIGELPKHIPNCPWVVFIAFNPRKIPSPRELTFSPGLMRSHPAFNENSIGDTGSGCLIYLKKHPEARLREFIWLYGCTLLDHCTPAEIKRMKINPHLMQLCRDVLPHTVQLFLFEHFVHIGRGSFEPEGHHKVVRHFHEFVDKILAE